MKVAINGFGRIGRTVYKVLHRRGIEVVAVNDLANLQNLIYLLKYDSVFGVNSASIEEDSDGFIYDGNKVNVYSESDPSKLPWDKLGVDFVIEATGRFTTKDAASKHLQAGAKRVVISAPSKDTTIPILVMGVNEKTYSPNTDSIVSCASCTTNCLAPIVKVLLDNWGIEEGLMTTVHAVTATQPAHDSPSPKGFRDGRAAFMNIIPAATGAAKAVARCLPEIEGKLTGMSFRVPVIDVSVVDLTVKLEKETSYEDICDKMKDASLTHMKGVLGYTEDPVVSTDFISDPRSSIFDAKAGIALNGKFYKLISWYDNESGYSERIVELILHMSRHSA